MMPFLRTCPHCGARIRFGALPLACFLGLLYFLHSSIEVSAVIARRWAFDRDNTFICTALTFAVPFWLGLYFLWKHGGTRGSENRRVRLLAASETHA